MPCHAMGKPALAEIYCACASSEKLPFTAASVHIHQSSERQGCTVSCGRKMKLLVLLFSIVALTCANDNVRLVSKDGFVNTLEGRVQVQIQGKWGEVCADNFGATDAGVVCRELGNTGNSQVESGAHGIGSEGILIGNVECTGEETSILQCPHE